MEMTEKQKEKLQVCEGTIAGVKRIDKQRIEEPREEVGVKESFTRKLVVSWLNGLERRRDRVRLERRVEGEEEDRHWDGRPV